MFGSRYGKEEIIGGDATTNAQITADVLSGKNGACRKIVVLNSALAIVAGEKASRSKRHKNSRRVHRHRQGHPQTPGAHRAQQFVNGEAVILDAILEKKSREVAELNRSMDFARFDLSQFPPTRDFRSALMAKPRAIIAEVKGNRLPGESSGRTLTR